MIKVAVKSDVVRHHLARRNINQNNLALKANVSQGYLSQLLKGSRFPGPNVRGRLMKALRIKEFEELFEMVPEGAPARH